MKLEPDVSPFLLFSSDANFVNGQEEMQLQHTQT